MLKTEPLKPWMLDETPPATRLPRVKPVAVKSASGRIWTPNDGCTAGRSMIHSALEARQVVAAHCCEIEKLSCGLVWSVSLSKELLLPPVPGVTFTDALTRSPGCGQFTLLLMQAAVPSSTVPAGYISYHT